MKNELIAQEKLIKQALEAFRQRLGSEAEKYPRRVQDALRYIHVHLFEQTLTVGEVKRLCHCSNNNISTVFRRVVRVGMREYIMGKRMEAAAYALEQHEVSISLLASFVGYETESFSRLFRRKYGCTPNSYRGRREADNEQKK